MTILAALPEPSEPEPCVTQGAPSRALARPSAVILIIVVGAWWTLVIHGVAPEAAAAGLSAAVGLGLRIAARPAKPTEVGRHG